MDPRTARRYRKLKLAERLAARLNAPTGKQSRRIRKLATEKPRLEGIVPNGRGGTEPGGYLRSTVSTLRRYGWATLYWHAKSRTFRVKINRAMKGTSERQLLLDAFAKVSGIVSLCACGLFFAKQDGRQRFCSAKCADRVRQRRARARRHSTTAKGKIAIARADTVFAIQRQRRADGRAAAAYVADQVAEARDAQARREQARLRHEEW